MSSGGEALAKSTAAQRSAWLLGLMLCLFSPRSVLLVGSPAHIRNAPVPTGWLHRYLPLLPTATSRPALCHLPQPRKTTCAFMGTWRGTWLILKQLGREGPSGAVALLSSPLHSRSVFCMVTVCANTRQGVCT